MNKGTNNKFLLPYEQWKNRINKKITDDINRIGNKKWAWQIHNVRVIDSGHGCSHLPYKFIAKVLYMVDFDMLNKRVEKIFEQIVDFGNPIGYRECVSTNMNDKIIYKQRQGRYGKTRFVLNRLPEPCNTIFIVLRKIKKNFYQLITLFIGTKAGKEPWDKHATAFDIEFWKNHALIADKDWTESDDEGPMNYTDI